LKRLGCAAARIDAALSANLPTYRPLRSPSENLTMLETIAVILLICWALGLLTSYTMGGFIHILLVVAIIVILVRVIQGRRL
jgi:hypothetical protein